jgi:hypothetical protein
MVVKLNYAESKAYVKIHRIGSVAAEHPRKLRAKSRDYSAFFDFFAKNDFERKSRRACSNVMDTREVPTSGGAGRMANNSFA